MWWFIIFIKPKLDIGNIDRLIHALSFTMPEHQDQEGEKTEGTGKSIGEENK